MKRDTYSTVRTLVLLAATVAIVVVALGALLPAFPAPAPSMQEVPLQGGLDTDQCDLDVDGRHFNATQSHDTDLTGSFVWIDHTDAPDHAIPLDRRTGGVAHYLGTDHGVDAGIDGATLHIAQGWDGQFVLSHRPCDGTPTPTFAASMTIRDDGECGAWPVVDFTVEMDGPGQARVTVVGPGGDLFHDVPVTADAPVVSFFSPLEPGTYLLQVDGDTVASVDVREPEACPTETETPSPTPTPTSTPTTTPTPTVTPTPTPTGSESPSPSSTPSPEPTPTTPSPAPSNSPTASSPPSETPTPTASPSPEPTSTPSGEPSTPASPLSSETAPNASSTPRTDLPRTGTNVGRLAVVALGLLVLGGVAGVSRRP